MPVIPISDIYVQEGANPRHHFDFDKLKSLANSIREHNVIQPVVIRERPTEQGRYELLAGERRVRAATMAGLSDIPAEIKDVDDRQARVIARIENFERENLSPTEEARAARDTVDELEGDRDKAATELGWSRTKLDARLLLLSASKTVQEALMRGQIKIGHAELLAGLPHSTQDGSLPKIIDESISVAQLKAKLAGVAIDLSEAVFSTNGCQGCPHNSQTQASLFGEHLNGARCQNRSCFAEKTTAHLSVIRDELAERFSTVKLATEFDPSTVTIVLADDVGPEQMSACRGCKNFGAAVNDHLDGKTGKHRSDICFDLQCHGQKTAAWAYAKKQIGIATSEPSAEGAVAQPEHRTSVQRSTTKAKANTLPNKVAAIIEQRVRQGAAHALTESPRATLAVVVWRLLRGLTSKQRAEVLKQATDDEKWTDVDVGDLVRLDEKTLNRLMQALASTWIATNGGDTLNPASSVRRAGVVLKSCERPLSDVFVVDAEFLSSLTRAGIEAVLDDTGFSRWLAKQPDHEKKEKQLKAAKVKELPQLILTMGFDWTGKVPSMVTNHLKSFNKKA